MRKILMMSSIWNVPYMNALLRGIEKRMQDEEIVLHIFNAYDTIGESDYSLRERHIFDIPDASNYDGVLIAINSVSTVPHFNSLIPKLREQNKNILSIDQEFEGISHIGIDNYHIFYELVEHLVEKHGCKVFNYVGGPENNEENQLRFKGFCDCLRDHNIPIDPRRVKHMHFLYEDGQRAYDAWKPDNLHLADAVVCASDFMALSYIISAKKDNYTAPEDFLISGFDNIEEAQLFAPTLTSVNRNWEQLGYDSLSVLFDLIDGKTNEKTYYTNGLCVYNQSCGCQSKGNDRSISLREAYDEKKSIQRLDIAHARCQRELCSTDIGPKFSDSLNVCTEQMRFSKIGVHIDPVFNFIPDFQINYSNSYDKENLIYTNKGEEYLEGVLPISWKKDTTSKIYFFSPLHFAGDKIGYFVVPYYDSMLSYDKHRKFQDNLALSLSIALQKKRLHDMNEKLQTLYIQDQLTGLYNRFGYESMAKDYFHAQRGKVYIMFMDVDNLKLYNDKYGHSMGDLAISGMAFAIKSVLKEAPIKARMGGDEFLAIGPYTDEESMKRLEMKILDWLVDYSEINHMPFPLTSSIGYVLSNSENRSLENLVQEADHRMYESKKSKKGQV